jgi:ATP/maltotriose-dependent transcriptional regulator MalT
VERLAADTGYDAESVYSVTAGNAFFVTEMLAASGALPATVVDAVLGRVRQLDEGTQRALEQLSVVPSRVEHRVVEALVGGLDMLAEAERRGMLHVDRERVAFRHELARRAIEHSLPQTRRVALNRAVVTALLASPEPDLARVVHHAVQAGDVATIVRYGPTAGREAARAGSHRQALTHFEQVLAHEDQLAAEERPRVLEEYAWELYNAHRFAEAARSAERARELWCQLGAGPARVGSALVTLSRHRWMSNDRDGAWAAIEQAIEILDEADDPTARAQAHTYRGAILALHEQIDEAEPQLVKAQALAEEAGAASLVALCLNYRGICAMERRNEEEAIAFQQESLRRARAAHDGDRPELRAYTGEHIARSYANLAVALHTFERYDELDAVLAEGLPYAIDSGFTLHAYNMEIRRCASLIHRGEWDTAEAALRELDRAVADPGVLGRYMLPLFGRLLARRGRPDAEAVIARALEYGDASGVPGSSIEATLAYLEWAWLTGQPARAAARVIGTLAEVQNDRHRRLRAELLRYAKRAGLSDTGVKGAAPFEGCPEPWATGLRGDWFAAATQFQRVGDDYERALELAESGDIGVTTSALELLDALGADGAAALVRQRLRDLGATRIPRGPAAATKANPAGLTDRQLDVLRLLRDGLTNAEIADRLFLSVRTVDHHVAAILDKLQVSSRRTAAERADALGIG